ncbi:MAG: hypothetical protein ABIG11_02035, partial [bacterium]
MKLLGLKAEVSERNPPKLHYTLLRSSSYGRVLARIHPQSEDCGFPCPTAGTRLPSVGQGRVRRRIKKWMEIYIFPSFTVYLS